MKQKLIKTLARESFENNELDASRVQLIVARLKRKDTRTYIRALKSIEQEQTVSVEVATHIDEMAKKQLQLRFPDKKIVYTINKDILAGMRIIDNDILYDFSVQGKIDRVMKHLYETND